MFHGELFVLISQRRVGKSYAISDIVTANYFYPLGKCHMIRHLLPTLMKLSSETEPDGLKGEITQTRRPLKEGESMEWVLLSGVCVLLVNAVVADISCPF